VGITPHRNLAGPVMGHEEISPERAEAEARILSDPLAYISFNPAQIRFIQRVGEKDVIIALADMGNGIGKTFGLVSIWSALMFGTSNPLFSAPIFKSFPHPRDARFCGPAKVVEDGGPLQKAIKATFPWGRYNQRKSMGKGFYCIGSTDAGWTWDVMTYNQSREEYSGSTKGVILYSEPPPREIFYENIARGRAGCIHIMEMTPLDMAAWLFEEIVEPGDLTLDGRTVGKVVLVQGEIHENCRDHFTGGQLPHAAIEATIAAWPPEEREARAKGVPLHLSGRIYPQWGDANEMEELADYYQECWDKGKCNLALVLDPHDRKPWALAWKSIFPNDDRVTIAEWPPFAFHKASNSPVSDIEDYRDIILAAEDDLGRPADTRLIDPNFGNAPKSGMGKTVKGMLQEACRRCKKRGETSAKLCPHRIFFKDPPDSIAEGHMLVRRSVGNLSEGTRPKSFALKRCINTCYSMRHYAYAENTDASKGPSETPQFVHKDFADLERYLELSGRGKYQAPARERVLWKPTKRGDRWSAT